MNGSIFDARAERRDVLRGAFGFAAGALGAGLAAGLGTSVAQASTGTFPNGPNGNVFNADSLIANPPLERTVPKAQRLSRESLVAITNNGPRKGAQAPTLATIRQMPSIDGWQLHRTLNRGAENVPDERIANLDETTSAWIKISANADGSFTVMNGRTGVSKSYRR